MKLPALLASCTALLLSLVPGAHAAPGARLTESDVRAFMHEVAAASQARDVDRIGRLMAPECVVVFHSGDRRDQTANELDKAGYLARLREGYMSLADVQDYHYDTDAVRVQLTPDGHQAIVDADVTERLSFNDHNVVTHSHEASVVEARDGGLRLVKVVGTVSGKLQ
jgi:ketosteroid isomerase-like protein